MGCVVNGPGEGMHADIGIAGGKHKGALFKSGRVVASLPEAELIDLLIAELRAGRRRGRRAAGRRQAAPGGPRRRGGGRRPGLPVKALPVV